MGEVRKIEPTDLPEIAGWFSLRGAVPDQRILPETGLIEPGVAAGYLYLTNSKAAFIDPIVSNPKAKRLEAGKAIEAIILGLVARAAESGAVQVFGFSSVKSVVRLCRKLGFDEGRKKYSVMSRRVKWAS